MNQTQIVLLLFIVLFSWSSLSASEGIASSGTQISTFEFSGEITTAFGTLSIGDEISGTIQYDSDVSDIDPSPYVGSYPTTIRSFSLKYGEEKFVRQDFPGLIFIRDQQGCDCYFIDFELTEEVGSETINSFLVSIQNEFGPEAFTMFDSDALPLTTFPTPDITFKHFHFEVLGPRRTIGLAELDSFSLETTLVPEPSSWQCALFSLLGFIALRRRFIAPQTSTV